MFMSQKKIWFYRLGRHCCQRPSQNQCFAFTVFVVPLVLFWLIFSTLFYCNVFRFYSERTDLMNFKPHKDRPEPNWMERNGSRRWGKLLTLKNKKNRHSAAFFCSGSQQKKKKSKWTVTSVDAVFLLWPLHAADKSLGVWEERSRTVSTSSTLYRVTRLEAACRWKTARCSCPLIFVHT